MGCGCNKISNKYTSKSIYNNRYKDDQLKNKYQYGGDGRYSKPFYAKGIPYNFTTKPYGDDVPLEDLTPEYKYDNVHHYVDNTLNYLNYLNSPEYISRLKKEGFVNPEIEQQKRYNDFTTTPVYITNDYYSSNSNPLLSTGVYRPYKEYQKDYGVYFPFIDKDKLDNPEKNKSYELVHELTHDLIHTSDVSPESRNIFSKENYIGPKKGKEKDYYSSFDELYAFGNQFKAYLLDNNLWDPSKKFTEFDYNKLKELQRLNINNDNYEILNLLKKDAIIRMMNELAYQDNNKYVRHARYGGKIKK